MISHLLIFGSAATSNFYFVVVHIHTSSSGTIHKPLAMFLRQQGTLII